jgi:hypothetical protein
MGVLHIVPGYSAGGTLEAALRAAAVDEGLLKWPDDLSAGPIAPGDPIQREAWWGHRAGSIARELLEFWEHVEASRDRLVVWFGRHSASEFAFFLSWADRVGSRPYDIIDVTALALPFARPGPGDPPTWQAGATFMLNPEIMQSLLGSERSISFGEASNARTLWDRLKSENAPFRVVSGDELISAPIDHFDQLLLEQIRSDWQKVAYVIGNTMGYNSDPYYQVGDAMLHARLVALIEAGEVEVDSDPYDMHVCRVRLRRKGLSAADRSR